MTQAFIPLPDNTKKTARRKKCQHPKPNGVLLGAKRVAFELRSKREGLGLRMQTFC